jgi:hypothetical protein
MLILLLCLLHAFVPDLVALVRGVEIHAFFMALGVFSFILLRLRR